MKITILDRRRFMAQATTASAAVVVGTSGGVTLMSSEAAWAVPLKTVDEAGAKRLLAMIRTLYPHDRLSDAYYAEALAGIDAKAAGDKQLKTLLTVDARKLDEATTRNFADLPEADRIAVLKSIEDTPFFKRVANEMLVAFYNNKKIWPEFEYQGSSFEYGGYLKRGFQDAAWTGDPPPEASPPPYLG
ncbi:Tat (twin-arginine translocation) pathway signal sequence [Arboricoccus pini]|uniref:Tat (Twin-arginine translocation) pathway signal sequence n=1 Tax=Arboricoccus pini TaxID=1963835 RepID=A0A212RZN3_9PROT|nr:twin-arginine translocation signal domain-containing protein [Arboricoccus pini]SNB78345.1 Tat (twin-arginine translocation) pathway signal sequence [Arboricoccus pini]